MIQEFDPHKSLRGLQNLLLTSVIAVSIIYSLILMQAFMMLAAIGGKAYIISFIEKITKDMMAFFVTPAQMLIYYWSWWWEYKALLKLNGANYLGIKLLLTCGIPTLSVFYVLLKYREAISKFEPIKREKNVHGDAHWATESEIVEAGLRSNHGLLMGRDDKGYLVAGGYQHALLFAPTGSGKGVGFVVPNLLFWRESIICHDIKLENYTLTSGWRAQHLKQDVFVWEPSNIDGRTHCYNPIDWISTKPGQMVDDVQKMANLILQKREFWENEARTLLVGLILYLVADDSKIKSFGEVVRTLRGDDFTYSMAVVLDTMGEKIHPVAYMNLAAFLQKADKERSGVISTLNSGLELWANPIIDTSTARSDFNFEIFKKKCTTVYVGLTPDNIQRLKPLMAMFYQQATDFLTKKLPQEDEPYGVLLMMDEFPTLGKLEQFLAGIAYFRGYHVRLFLIVQDTQQLKAAYEDSGMNSFLSNATYRITFAANNIETAKLISDLIGNQTVETSSYNRPRFFDLNPASRSVNMSQTQRALLLPQEVINMPKDDQIILVEASPPIRTKKIKYYEDKSLRKKIIDPVPLPIQEVIVHARPMSQEDGAEKALLENNQNDDTMQ